MPEDLPPLVTKLTADLGGLDQGLARGKTEVKAWKQEVASEFNGGRAIGATFGKDLGDGIQDAIPDGGQTAEKVTTRLRDARGRFVTAGQDSGTALGEGISKGVDPGLDEVDRKIVDKAKKAGQGAGKAAGEGMSPLIVSALVGAGALGGSLLVAGVGTAMVGATALVLSGNKAIAADLEKTGKDAAGAVQQAASPLAGIMHSSLVDVDAQVNKLAPDFKQLFSGVAPDIAPVTSGLTGLVGSLLPGMARATQQSQVIVRDFADSLPTFGREVGQFFTGLTQNADTQGRALGKTVDTLGNVFDTAGTVIGSAGAAASGALLTLDPLISKTATAIRDISSPATVGGLAGAFGAMKLGGAVQSGLLSGAEGLSKIADKAEDAGGRLGRISGAAGGASGALAKMAGIAGGPWGIAIGAGIGLASALAGALFRADDATRAITVSQGDLAAAVAQDGAKAGQATSAYIAQQAQISGLANEAKGAGVSLSLLTEAATGNQSALSQLTAVTGQANDVQRQQQLAAVASLDGQAQLTQAHQQGSVAVNSLFSSTTRLASGQDQLNQSFTTGSERLAQGTIASDTLTDANQKLLNSVRAQQQQVVTAIQQQADYQRATNDLNNTTQIFNATLDADYQKLVAKNQATAASTVAALNFGTGQSALNQTLAAAVTQYGLAKDAASGYGTALQALSGSYGGLQAAEAQTDQNLQSLLANQTQLGSSFKVGKDAGDSNIQMMNTYAQSIIASAQALVQQDTQTGRSSQATQDLTTYINKQRDAFVAQEAKLLGSRDAAQKLFDQFINIKGLGSIDVPVTANTAPAVDAANRVVRYINSLTGTITVQTGTGSSASGVSYNPKSGGGKAYYDFGGWTRAAAGQSEEAVVHGGEYVLSRDMLSGRQQVDARVLAALRTAGVGLGGPGAYGSTAGGGTLGLAGGAAGPTVVNVYLDGKLIGRKVTRGSRAEAQQYKVRNSQTGFN